MTLVEEQFRSEYGWSILLPKSWEPLPSAESADALIVAPPVVFACSKDWSLTLTWMVESHPSDPKVVEAFLNATILEGPVSPSETQPIVQRIWPPLGQITEAEVVELPDTRRALETVEEYQQGSESRGGYQLILLDSAGPDKPANFQRLCFYAPSQSFAQHIHDVRTAARTFHYSKTS